VYPEQSKALKMAVSITASHKAGMGSRPAMDPPSGITPVPCTMLCTASKMWNISGVIAVVKKSNQFMACSVLR